MSTQLKRDILFVILIVAFVLTFALTFLGVIGAVDVAGEYLGLLVTSVLIEVAVAFFYIAKTGNILGAPQELNVAGLQAELAGGWWQRFLPRHADTSRRDEADIAISYFTLDPLENDGSGSPVRMTGRGFSSTGKMIADFVSEWSVATARGILFGWKGRLVNETQSFDFNGTELVELSPRRKGELGRGAGWFTSGGGSSPHVVLNFWLVQATDAEVEVMGNADERAVGEFVREKLAGAVGEIDAGAQGVERVK